MPDFVTYSLNRHTGVEQIDDTTFKSACRLNDTLTEAVVEIVVRLPDLEIAQISGRYLRTVDDAPPDPDETLQKLVGVRIGAGMLKIIKGLVGDIKPFEKLIYMVEECCHGIILTFTKNELLSVPTDPEDKLLHFRNMVKQNIRLYNRCAAFAPGSPIVEGIEPP